MEERAAVGGGEVDGERQQRQLPLVILFLKGDITRKTLIFSQVGV